MSEVVPTIHIVDCQDIASSTTNKILKKESVIDRNAEQRSQSTSHAADSSRMSYDSVKGSQHRKRSPSLVSVKE